MRRVGCLGKARGVAGSKVWLGAALAGVLMGFTGVAPAAGEPVSDAGTAHATFAGGCFWCMEPPFDKMEGVSATVSGYTGGDVVEPSYEQVSSGGTGHAEAVRITYDPRKVSYAALLKVFWRNIDPVAVDRQFCDTGSQYRSAIFYHNAEQKRLAERSKQRLADSGRLDEPIATEIEPAGPFFEAEAYHQNYYQKNPLKYKFYRYRCGRDDRLEAIWGEAAGG